VTKENQEQRQDKFNFRRGNCYQNTKFMYDRKKEKNTTKKIKRVSFGTERTETITKTAF